MDNRENGKEPGEFRLSVDDLKGKQSVRATFKLSVQSIDLLTIISGQLGIKQKSLFDRLIENQAVINQVAHVVPEYSPKNLECRQKTFVISRSTLQSLNRISRRQNISRDLLVEISINQLLPVIQIELEKHSRRKQILMDMKIYLQDGNQLLEKTEELLGKEDRFFEMIKKQVTVTQKTVSALENVVEKGRAMEQW